MRLIFLVLLSVSLGRAEDWTASDGTVYKGVKVLSHDAAYVTILDSDGGGRVPLRLLNADLQKKFGFDAAKAKAVEAATAAQDKADLQALAVEEEAAEQARQKHLIALQQDAAPAPAAAAASTTPAPAVDQISSVERADIQAQIDSLNADIAMMKREVAKISSHDNGAGYVTSSNGQINRYTGGGYPAKIQDDQQQIAQLQRQLSP